MTLTRAPSRVYRKRQPLALLPRAFAEEFEVEDAKDNDVADSIAVVYICGPLEHHQSWCWDSYDAIIKRLESAFCDSDVQSVVMCIDSPGGDASGCSQAHDKIQRLKKKYKKKLYAYSNESMYSAAYAIGSAADEIWVPDTGGVGSVGVICSLLDQTQANKKAGLNVQLLTTGARKADSQADRVLTDEVVSVMQDRVDYLGKIFFTYVAKARSMSPKDVQNLEAGVFLGQDAVDAGLADAVGGWYPFLEHVAGELGSSAETTVDQKLETTEDVEDDAKGSKSMNIEQLKKAKALAAKKLLGAKSSERKGLFSAYEKATIALAEFQAKTKYTKKTEEKLEKDKEDEDDDDDSEDDDDDDGEDTESDGEDDEESESSEDSEEDSEEEDSEEDSEEGDDKKKSAKSKASKRAKEAAASMSLKSAQRLFSLVQNLTGKSDMSEVFGALEGMTPRVKNMNKSEERIAKLEETNKKSRVKAMLDVAMKDGRITPAQAKGLEPQGMKDTKWLRGYLGAQPKQYRSQEEAFTPNEFTQSPTLDSQGLDSDKQKMLLQASQAAGMSVEDYSKEVSKHNGKANGSGRLF